MEKTIPLEKPAQVKPEKIKFTPYQVTVIVLLALTQFSVVLDFMVMSPLGDMLMKSMSLTPTQFGLVVSAYGISAGISGLLTAGFADKFDRKKLLQFFYVGFILGTLFCGLATNYPMLIAARIVTGIFGGVIGSISMAIVADIFPLQQRGRVMGFMQMGFGASQVLGIPISLYIANAWDWKAPFIMIVGFATIILVAITLKLKPVIQHLDIKNERNALNHLLHTIKQRHYRTGFLATALLSLGGFMMMPWGSAFAVNNLHVSQEQLPLLFMVGGVSTLFIMPLVGRFSDKIDKNLLFAIASIWMIAVVLVYTNLTPVPLWVVMIFNVLMMIGIMSRMVPSMALVSALPEMHDRGAFMSINSSLQQIAGGLAAGVGGMIVVQKDKFSPLEHYNTLGIVVSVLSLFGIYAVFRVSKMVKAKAAATAN
ncbi:MAG: MFS transporter [Bacteroidetes bacterium]|nr:MFS transporter [Bacteroidota bacterium]